MKDAYRHIKDDCQLKQVLCQEAEEIKRCAFQSINLMTMAESALSHTYKDCIFIGCQLPMGLKKNSKDCLFLPDMGETFRYRNHLYTPEELYEGYSPAIKGSYEKCFDGRVYKHYLKKGKRSTDAKETLARTLHDHSISDCLHDFLSNYDERSLVGIMGGHHLSRRDIKTGEVIDHEFVQRLYSAAELRKTLLKIGFKSVEIYGDFMQNPYDENMATMVLVCEK